MPLFRGNQAPTNHKGVTRRKDHAGAQSAFGENPIETGCARAGRAMPFDLKTASLRLKKKYSEPGYSAGSQVRRCTWRTNGEARNLLRWTKGANASSWSLLQSSRRESSASTIRAQPECPRQSPRLLMLSNGRIGSCGEI